MSLAEKFLDMANEFKDGLYKICSTSERIVQYNPRSSPKFYQNNEGLVDNVGRNEIQGNCRSQKGGLILPTEFADCSLEALTLNFYLVHFTKHEIDCFEEGFHLTK